MTLLRHLFSFSSLIALSITTPAPAPVPNFSCPGADPKCLGSFFNLSSVLDRFMGVPGNETVILRDELVTLGMGVNETSCKPMSVIFARGTLEPGNVGILTGPPFFASLASYMNTSTHNIAIQGVSYPADIAGFLAGGSALGAQNMATLVNHTLTTCPSTALTLSGYSQGAQVVHLALASMPASMTSRISSVVLFGDPKNGTLVGGVDAGRVLTVCHAGDDICEGGDEIGLAHLNYSSNAQQAAMFVLGGVAKLGITSQSMKSFANGKLGS